ncbi:MAG: hypothetical protein L0Y60_16815 [Beijerinckiaceae bacterium]|nr:hypothetical protein [Beijerinckiaceae bacterium]
MHNRTRSQVFVEAALRAQAARTAVGVIKQRARVYARRPMSLESVFPGLSAAAPETIIAVAKHLIVTEREAPRRWLGFGGEVSLLNAKAVLLLGRALRRATSARIPR